MNFKRLTLLLVIVMACSFSLSAKSIDVNNARNAATAFYYEQASQRNDITYKDLTILNESVTYSDNVAVYYIFNFSRGGWVLMAADDRIIPVIGYSFEGIYDPGKVTCCLNWWMTQVEKEIAEVITEDGAAIEGAAQKWDYLLSRNASNVHTQKAKDIAPLTLATWDQGKYYNALCPLATGGPDGRALVGCVATSMAQVMFYYRFPAQGLGTHGGINLASYYYRWNEMLNALGNYNQGVAEICYHAGVTVNMSYGATGSGANSTDIPSALENHFRYSSDCNYAQKFAYTTTNWNNLLKGNLDAGHPMIYSGTDPDNGGHAWVCDGYQGTDYFHMNWGWSGYGNGYFYLNNLSVAGNNFSDWQGLVYNIYPPTGSYPTYCTGTTNVNYSIGTIEDGSGPNNYQNNSSCQWLIDPTEIVARITISVNAINTESANDVITIYDGDNTGAPVLATWSGTTIPSSVSTTGDKALVVFTTNGSTTASGWQLEYRSTYPVYCSGITTLTTPSGSIDDGSGANPYSYNQTCRWYIQPANVSSITLSFSEFNVASDDWVNIYNGDNADLLDSYYGTSIPAQATYPIDNVLIYFKTNSTSNGNGWALTYSSTPLGQQENGLPGVGIWPNPAKDKLYLGVMESAAGAYELQIYTIDGRLVQTQTIRHNESSFTEEIDISGLRQGAYIVRVRTDQGSMNSKLLVD
jgi:hypothetical protein